ncbi:hypothetical protein XENOCAPTIV_029304 [Xenoophorus captivus]|uniref:Uncharacterized protein n=1 Tax=Xenoophorus captivus TaxID=1517983 RepID=A0ABV0QCD7_9TELE
MRCHNNLVNRVKQLNSFTFGEKKAEICSLYLLVLNRFVELTCKWLSLYICRKCCKACLSASHVLGCNKAVPRKTKKLHAILEEKVRFNRHIDRQSAVIDIVTTGGECCTKCWRNRRKLLVVN